MSGVASGRCISYHLSARRLKFIAPWFMPQISNSGSSQGTMCSELLAKPTNATFLRLGETVTSALIRDTIWTSAHAGVTSNATCDRRFLARSGPFSGDRDSSSRVLCDWAGGEVRRLVMVVAFLVEDLQTQGLRHLVGFRPVRPGVVHHIDPEPPGMRVAHKAPDADTVLRGTPPGRDTAAVGLAHCRDSVTELGESHWVRSI